MCIYMSVVCVYVCVCIYIYTHTYEGRLRSTWTHLINRSRNFVGGAVTVSFSKYLPRQAMHFLQRSTHFSKTCCTPFAASFRRIVEQAVLTSHVRFSVSKAVDRSLSHCIVSIGLMDEL
jgi:hypothetical protein